MTSTPLSSSSTHGSLFFFFFFLLISASNDRSCRLASDRQLASNGPSVSLYKVLTAMRRNQVQPDVEVWSRYYLRCQLGRSLCYPFLIEYHALQLLIWNKHAEAHLETIKLVIMEGRLQQSSVTPYMAFMCACCLPSIAFQCLPWFSLHQGKPLEVRVWWIPQRIAPSFLSILPGMASSGTRPRRTYQFPDNRKHRGPHSWLYPCIFRRSI